MFFPTKQKQQLLRRIEYDRSFLTLSPNIAVVTSTDADHLDIYNEHDGLLTSFQDYVNKLPENGTLVLRKGLNLNFNNIVTYSATEKADYYAVNIQIVEGVYSFDVQTPTQLIKNVKVGLPGLHNVENAIATFVVGELLLLSENQIKNGLVTFQGVKRRFEYQVKTNDVVYIDDYAHHPEELKACISSVRMMYPTKKLLEYFSRIYILEPEILQTSFPKA